MEGVKLDRLQNQFYLVKAVQMVKLAKMVLLNDMFK